MVSRAFIVSSIVAILSIFSVYKSIYICNLDLSYRDPGVVVDKFKSDKLEVSKHSSDVSTHLYVVVKYDRGYTDQVDVDANTFYNYNIGNRITFIKSHDYFSSTFKGGLAQLGLIVGDIMAFIYAICLIVGLSTWSKHVLENKSFWD